MFEYNTSQFKSNKIITTPEEDIAYRMVEFLLWKRLTQEQRHEIMEELQMYPDDMFLEGYYLLRFTLNVLKEHNMLNRLLDEIRKHIELTSSEEIVLKRIM